MFDILAHMRCVSAACMFTAPLLGERVQRDYLNKAQVTDVCLHTCAASKDRTGIADANSCKFDAAL